MANYSALWTSSNDREYLQMKKVKQLTERHLAMDIVQMDKTCRRGLRKAQEKIRENQDILESLEREKEKRARSILATYHKHQRMKAAADRFIGKFRMIKQRKGPSDVPNKKKLAEQEERQLLSRKPGLRHRVLMVHTFPYVYHSYGDKPCPRYDMFLESNEYGPPDVTSTGQRSRPSILTTKRNSVDKHPLLSATSAVPTLPAILENDATTTPTKSKIHNVMTAFKAVGALSKH